MTDKSLEQKVKDLVNIVECQQHEIKRLQAINEIQNLISR